MDNAKKVTSFTISELYEKVEKDRSERLQNGLIDGNFRVYFQRSNLTIQIEENGRERSEIDLEDCNTSSELLSWIIHLHGKQWGCTGGLIASVLTVLEDACHEVFGSDVESLFQDGKVLDWKNPR
jgi:hypothetical protein